MRRSTRSTSFIARLFLSCVLALAASGCGSCDDSDGGVYVGDDAAGQADGDSPDDNLRPDVDIGEHTVDETGVGQVTVLPEAPALDILWVIDNSGSMCDERELLRDNFQESVLQLADRGVDFQVAVTTTQMDPGHMNEARPGELQTEPTPSATFTTCLGDEGDPDDPDDGYQRLRQYMADAVECTRDPGEWQHLLEYDDDDIKCHIEQTCGEYYEVFPHEVDGESPYRDTPRVVRSTAYDEVNKVDVEKLSKDFSCLSMVGTSGSPLEKGLSAAVEAVSPEKTGGTPTNPTDDGAPNHGLLREHAQFAPIFLTDENDCSHDGTLEEQTPCMADICEVANHPDFPDSPLLDPADVADDLLANLAASKGRDVARDEILAASFHGRWKRYGATADYPEGDAFMSFEECENGELIPEELQQQPSCNSEYSGTAYSGDRYERFVREFPNFFPYAEEGEHMPGAICESGQIPQYLAELGDFAAIQNPHCIDQALLPCQDGSADACPELRHADTDPSCVTPNNSTESVCDSAMELQLVAGGADTANKLEQTGFCVPETIGADGLDDACVVDRSKYEVVPCAAGLGFRWEDSVEVNRKLDEVVVRVRYLTEDWEG